MTVKTCLTENVTASSLLPGSRSWRGRRGIPRQMLPPSCR